MRPKPYALAERVDVPMLYYQHPHTCRRPTFADYLLEYIHGVEQMALKGESPDGIAKDSNNVDTDLLE